MVYSYVITTEYQVEGQMETWLTDSNGNKCSVEYFGSKEKAQQALDSLENCRDCVNSSDCSDCSHIASLYSKKNLHGDPEAISSGVPPIPKIENIHQKIFEAVSKPKAFNMNNWHSCNTTHCRGGWVVHLAGDAGYALERFHDTLLAAQLIYRESGYPINPCRFFDNNEDAMEDMRKLANTK